MLTAKYSRIHGMKNEKWPTREKMSQYRAILKLHARDKKLHAVNGAKLKRKVSRNLKELNEDIKSYRQIVNDVLLGDKRLIRMVLQTEQDFRIQLQDAEPLDAYKVVFQDYNLKRKQLDKLLHQKEKTMKDVCNLKAEYETLKDQLEEVHCITVQEEQQEIRQQLLMARYQNALSKRHAAKSISDTYRQLLDILKKDSMYFDGVLSTLKLDRRDQCRIIYRTALMGQLATETLDDIRQKYKQLARDVWANMKEREKSLEITRRKVEDVWEYAKSLVRIESEQNLLKAKPSKVMNLDKRLQVQIKNLENIFNKMKDQLLVRSYEELFARLETQMKQRTRLSELYKRSIKDRNEIFNKKSHAELILKNLEHSMLSSTTKYKSDKQTMLAKIKEEKKREEENILMIETRGELLMKIREALQNMSSMLVCIKAVKAGKKEGKKGRQRDKDDEDEEKTEEELEREKSKEKPCHDNVEEEALLVLTQVTRKATTLFTSTNFGFDKTKERRAKEAYEKYLAEFRSKLKFGGEEVEQTMYFEHEAVDTSVMTRADIKKKSKHIVEINTKED